MSRPLNFVSPGNGVSGLKMSFAVSCQTNLPSMPGENSTYGVDVHVSVESLGTTARENWNSKTALLATTPLGSGDFSFRPPERNSVQDEIRETAMRATKRRRWIFMVTPLKLLDRHQFIVRFGLAIR